MWGEDRQVPHVKGQVWVQGLMSLAIPRLVGKEEWRILRIVFWDVQGLGELISCFPKPLVPWLDGFRCQLECVMGSLGL